MKQLDANVKKTSLTKKIMMAFMLPIAIGIFITMIVLFISIKKDKIEEVQALTALMNINMLDRIDRFTSEVELLAQTPEIVSLDYTKAESFLNEFMKKTPEVWSHFLITDGTGFNIAHTDGQKSRGVSIADRTYFAIPWKEEKTDVADPTFSKSTGRRILAIGTPIYDNGVKTGVLVGFVRLEYISEILNDHKLSKNSFTFMINERGLLVAHPNQNIVLIQNWFKPGSADNDSQKYVASMSSGFKKIIAAIVSGKSGVAFTSVDKRLSLICYGKTGISNISLVSVSPVLEVFAIFIVVCLSMAFIFIVLIVISVIFGRSIVRPLLKITEALPAIAEGDFTLNLNISGTDESAQLAWYFNQTIEKIRESILAVKKESELMQKTGALLSVNASHTANAVHQISANIDSIKHQVVNESAGVTQTQATVGQIVKNIENLNREIEKQSESIADSTAATEEMVANIRSVFDILGRNTKEVEKLSGAAQKGRESLSQAATITEKIASESDGLLEASSVIENIASQTNLLAMNAAIEAAHAGDAGKGFAVVAGEIRKLAEDSSSQSKSITLVLKKLKNDIGNLTQSSDYVQQQFTSIFDLTQNVQNQGQTVNNMMQEQAEANEQVLKSMQQISGITAGVKQGSAQMLQGSREISIEMQKLAEITDTINGSMNNMASGTNEITNATQAVNDISQQANESIRKVLQTVNVFKV